MNSKWTNLCALLLMTLGLSACGGGGDGGSDDVANNDGSALGTPSPPIDEAPLDEAPLDEAPLDEAPLDEAPLDGAPLDGAPLDGAPLDGAPLDEAPLDGAPVGLAELPNPPLTEGPSADDEPVAFDSELHTITQFQALRDTGPRISKAKEANEFTQEDFDAGLPDAVITVPNDVDPETNAPPFFEGLANVRIEAGQTLQLLFDPVDPEGDLPGMFGQELPPGASFDDNRDGTRTLEWTPLQGDVGITEFTAVAIDPDNSNYRSSQMVLIAVDEPSNLAGIPNVPPGIEPVADYTVRVGDPVSIFLIGTDRNGTVPTIELQNPPPSAILTPDPRTPEIQILQVVPDSAGTLVIDILTRDADDPLLTGLNQITLEVLDADAFERGGERLRNAVAGSGVAFGSAVSPVFYLQADGGVYEAFAGSEFGVMSPESSMKWDAINPLPGRFEWADMDTLLNFAEFYDMEVRGHTLIWYTSLPSWVEQTEPEDREVHMREYITRVMTRYADRVDYWDVVNEPISEEDGLRDSIWFEAMGEGYIDTAFLQARELAPNATLVLNEFDIGFAGRKFDDFLSLIDRLLEREVPVDAIGFQMHVFSSYDQYDEFAANMAEIAARGLDIHVTELDVAIVGDDTEEVQAEVYERVAETCLAQPRCTVLQTWGFTDRYSFRRFTSPLYLDENHQVKPSYDALRSGLSGE